MSGRLLAQKARAVERDVFGALIGALGGVVVARFGLLVANIDTFALGALLLIGAWTGAFVAHVATNRSASAMDSIRSLSSRFRSVGLRFVLWMLGAAAGLGVLSVLTGSYEVVGRVAATAAVTGLAAGFLFPLLPLLDEGKKWRVGLLGTASVFAAYILGLPSIWELGYRPTESAISGLVVVLMMPASLVAMQLTHEDNTQTAGWFAAIVYLLALSLFLCAVWDDRWHNEERFLETGFSALGFGAFAVICLVNAFSGDGQHWRWLGFAAAVFVGGLVIWGIWTRNYVDSDWVVTLTSLPAVIAIANLSLLVPLEGGQVWCRAVTIVAAVVTAIALDAEVWINNGASSISFVGRVAIAGAIVTSTGTLALLILARLNHPGRVAVVANASGAMSEITLHCPKCGKQQTIGLIEPARCECGLQIRVYADDAMIE